MSSMMGGGGSGDMMGKMEKMRELIQQVNKQFKDAVFYMLFALDSFWLINVSLSGVYHFRLCVHSRIFVSFRGVSFFFWNAVLLLQIFSIALGDRPNGLFKNWRNLRLILEILSSTKFWFLAVCAANWFDTLFPSKANFIYFPIFVKRGTLL